MAQPTTFIQALHDLQGSVLTSAERVEDYMQLVFDKTVLNVYNKPILAFGQSRQVTWDDESFMSDLSVLVGKTLTSADIFEGGIHLRFSPTADLWLSLKEADYLGPEALEMKSPSSWFVI